MKIGYIHVFFGWFQYYCIKSFDYVNTLYDIPHSRYRLSLSVWKKSGKAPYRAILEGRAVDALDDDPIVRPMQMVDIVIYDHSRCVFSGGLHAQIGLLLLQNDVRPKDRRHGSRIGQAQTVQAKPFPIFYQHPIAVYGERTRF